MKITKKAKNRGGLPMIKKILAVLITLAALAALVLMPGCANNSARDEDTITLMVETSCVETLYMQRILELYETETGNKIKIIPIENTTFEADAYAKFEKGEIPDIFMHYNDSDLTKYNVAENFLYLNDEPWVGELTDSAKAYCLDKDGNLLGLPFWESSVSGCYYNKTVLDSLGLRPAYTQAEFDALCAALKGVGYTPMYWASNGCNWIFQFGLDPIFADDPELLEKLNKNEITYADIPAVRDMITWLDNANRNGWFNADYAGADWDSIAPAIGKGDAVMIYAWDSWFSMNLNGNTKYGSDDFALMPVFMNTADAGTYEGGNLAMMLVNKNSEKKQQALDFLAFCAAPENYNRAFEGVSTVSNFKNQTTNIQADMVTDALPSIEAHGRVSTAWPKIIGFSQDDVGDAVLKMFKGETDVDGCVRLMDEYRIAAAQKAGAAGF